MIEDLESSPLIFCVEKIGEEVKGELREMVVVECGVFVAKRESTLEETERERDREKEDEME